MEKMSTLLTLNKARADENPGLNDELTFLKKKIPNPVRIEYIYHELKKLNFERNFEARLKSLVTKDLNLVAV